MKSTQSEELTPASFVTKRYSPSVEQLKTGNTNDWMVECKWDSAKSAPVKIALTESEASQLAAKLNKITNEVA